MNIAPKLAKQMLLTKSNQELDETIGIFNSAWEQNREQNVGQLLYQLYSNWYNV